jgi:AraC family L-rhamnose operon transcriptional activator RhaR
MAQLQQFHLTDPRLFLVGHAPIAAKRYFVGVGSPAHDHDYVEIGIVVKGKVVDFDSDGERLLRRGDGYVIRPGGWHGNRPCKDTFSYNCCIAADLLDNHLAWMRQDPHFERLFVSGPAAPQNHCIQRFRLAELDLRACEKHLDEIQQVLAMPRKHKWLDELGRVCVFLAALSRCARPLGSAQRSDRTVAPDRRVGQVVQMLSADLAKSLSLAHVARSVGMDRYRLVRCFRDHSGLAPMAYRTRRRLEKAASMLLQSNALIGDVAASVGWNDQNYFARRFKRHFGVSPSVFRLRFYQSGGTPRGKFPGA